MTQINFDEIRQWAKDRGLIEGGNLVTQTVKLGEEYGELCSAVIRSNPYDQKDAIGDMVIVLTNLAAIRGWRIEDCIECAFEQIKDRKGRMHNGSFIKSQTNE